MKYLFPINLNQAHNLATIYFLKDLVLAYGRKYQQNSYCHFYILPAAMQSFKENEDYIEFIFRNDYSHSVWQIKATEKLKMRARTMQALKIRNAVFKLDEHFELIDILILTKA